LDRDERFTRGYISSPFPGFILTLRHPKPITEADLGNHNNRNTERNVERSEDRQGLRFHLETGVVTVAAISAKNIDLCLALIASRKSRAGATSAQRICR